jgi:predicted nucleic acid-binding protein
VEAVVLETSFLVDLERERTAARRARPREAGAAGPATSFLARWPDTRLYITITTAGELASGVRGGDREKWDALIRPYAMLGIDVDVCWEYSRALRYLSDNGMLIGANDLWIAATAIVRDVPLATRNAQHFARVPRLQVVDYAAPAE